MFNNCLGSYISVISIAKESHEEMHVIRQPRPQGICCLSGTKARLISQQGKGIRTDSQAAETAHGDVALLRNRRTYRQFQKSFIKVPLPTRKILPPTSQVNFWSSPQLNKDYGCELLKWVLVVSVQSLADLNQVYQNHQSHFQFQKYQYTCTTSNLKLTEKKAVLGLFEKTTAFHSLANPTHCTFSPALWL